MKARLYSLNLIETVEGQQVWKQPRSWSVVQGTALGAIVATPSSVWCSEAMRWTFVYPAGAPCTLPSPLSALQPAYLWYNILVFYILGRTDDYHAVTESKESQLWQLKTQLLLGSELWQNYFEIKFLKVPHVINLLFFQV